MRVLISLIFFCGFITSIAQAILPCSPALTRLGNTHQSVPQTLESIPRELLSPRAPSFEELEKLNVKDWGIPPPFTATKPFTEPKNLKPVLKLFEQIEGDADYIFVGNGYYLPYLMARAAFSGTPMEKRIKFIHFSRTLAKKSIENPHFFDPYFKSLGLDTGEASRKKVVIDSITTLGSDGGHSVIRTSNAVRNFLLSQGWPTQKAIQSVITLAMPEGDPDHDYRTYSLKEYQRQLSQFKSNQNGKSSFPYLDPQIDWHQSPFKDAYDIWDSDHYWNGKYNSVDSFGFPSGIDDIRPLLNTIPANELAKFLRSRAQKASLYQEVIKANQQNAAYFKKEIESILKRHHLK